MKLSVNQLAKLLDFSDAYPNESVARVQEKAAFLHNMLSDPTSVGITPYAESGSFRDAMVIKARDLARTLNECGDWKVMRDTVEKLLTDLKEKNNWALLEDDVIAFLQEMKGMEEVEEPRLGVSGMVDEISKKGFDLRIIALKGILHRLLNDMPFPQWESKLNDFVKTIEEHPRKEAFKQWERDQEAEEEEDEEPYTPPPKQKVPKEKKMPKNWENPPVEKHEEEEL